MTKSKFLKSVKLAIASAVIASSLSACSTASTTKEEKVGCASRDGKSGCATSVKEAPAKKTK